MAFEPIDVYLWQEQVFNYRVAKGYLTFKQLANFEVFSGEYQRELEQEHEDKIIQYLKNEKYRYLPDIVIVVRDKELQFIEWWESGNIFTNQSLGIRISQRKNCLARLQVWETSKKDEMLQKFKIVDGNHRLSAIKKLLENGESSFGDEIIGVTFIFMKEGEGSIKDELALFYYLNSKSKPLLPKDYLSNTLKEFEDSEELKAIDWWLFVFRVSNDKILEIFGDYKDKLEKDTIARACDYLAKNIENDEQLNEFFSFLRGIKQDNLKEILESFSSHNQLTEFICIVFFIYKKMKDDKAIKLEAEIKHFCEWLLEDAKLEKFQDFENLFLVYQNTYIPKSFKIFIAMEFKDSDDVYKAIEGTIEKVSLEIYNNKNLLNPLRIDKYITGTTYQIINEIFNQIDERGLVIADITNKNPNVYLEVGYTLALCRARGINDQLILLLKDDKNKQEDEKVGFDLRGYKWISYKNTEDLREKLEQELKQYCQTKYIAINSQ